MGQTPLADLLQTKDPEKTFERLHEHVAAVRRQHHALRDSKVIIIVERNLGFEAEHLFRYCRSIPGSGFLREKGNTRIGILTTQTMKMAYVSFLNILLREERACCVQAADFVDCGKNQTRSLLLDQLSFFGYSFSRPENQFQKQRFAIGGKTGGGKDDLAMALQFGLYFANDDRYGVRF